ncbi:MAG: hypothetical protein JWM31_1708 [Solirubrobacterales bacterium]|nr:hypothetical protein [Solirubrobacterales bacterium]
MRKTHLLTPLAGLAALAAVALPGAASARGTDRDHDHMPDRWESAHHLSTHRNDARRDADRDGLKNLAEFRAGTDPQQADTDKDGIRDGAEQAGTIVSFTGGVLTLSLFDGTTLAGTVDDATQIECDEAVPATTTTPAAPRSRGSDDGEDDARAEPPATPAAGGGSGNHGRGDDGDQEESAGEDAGGDCSPAALVTGAKVDEAVVALGTTGKRFRKIEIG